MNYPTNTNVCPFCGPDDKEKGCVHLVYERSIGLNPSMFNRMYFHDKIISDEELRSIENRTALSDATIKKMFQWYEDNLGPVSEFEWDFFDDYIKNGTFWSEVWEIFWTREEMDRILHPLIIKLLDAEDIPEEEKYVHYEGTLNVWIYNEKNCVEYCPEYIEDKNTEHCNCQINGKCYDFELTETLYLKNKEIVFDRLERILRFLLFTKIKVRYCDILKVLNKPVGPEKKDHIDLQEELKKVDLQEELKKTGIELSLKSLPDIYTSLLPLLKADKLLFNKIMQIGEFLLASSKNLSEASEEEKEKIDFSLAIQEKISLMRLVFEEIEEKYLFKFLPAESKNLQMRDKLDKLVSMGKLNQYVKNSLFYYWKLCSNYGSHYTREKDCNLFYFTLEKSFSFLIEEFIPFCMNIE